MKKRAAGFFGHGRWWIETGAAQDMIRKLDAITPEGLQAAEAAAVAYAGQSEPKMVGDVAVIPVCGPVFYKPSWYAMYFGGAIIQNIRAQFRTAWADPNVKAIVSPFDSPGGIVDMVPEFAKEIFANRGNKPMIAVGDLMIASAAYWLASQYDKIYVTETSRIGSIGVYSEHEDVSAMLERIGVKITLISYGEHKVDGNPYEPLSEAARAKIQADVDRTGDKFTKAVARGRGVTPKVVQSKYGQGQVFDGDEALALGMVDKIAGLDDVLTRVTKGRNPKALSDAARAADVVDRMVGDVPPALQAADDDEDEGCGCDGCEEPCPPECDTCKSGCSCMKPAETEASAVGVAQDTASILAALSADDEPF